MSDHSRTLLVTGASGHLGRRVVEILFARAGGDRIVAATRHPEKLVDLVAQDVIVRRCDFDDPVSLADTMYDAERVLIISTDAIDRSGHRAEQHFRAINAARHANVKHIVYTSFVRPDGDSPVGVAHDHRLTERYLADSGIGHTILRNNLYTENLLASLPHAIATGRYVAAAATGAIAFVAREDCARAAAAALADEFDGVRTFDVTGPEALTYAQVARIAGQIVGRPVHYEAIDAAAMRGRLVATGMPPHLADLVVSFDVGAAQGRLADVSDAVLALTGQPPIALADFLAAHRHELKLSA